jgi:ABC-2 type transport system ATP-binding protein
LNKEGGITIFLTTQYLEEADKLCDRLSIIDHGQIVAQGTPEEMKREISADAVSLTIANGRDVADSDHAIATAKQVLSKIGDITEIIDSENGLTVYGKNGAFMVPEIIRALDKAEVRISSINISSPTLDDVFLKHTGRRIRTEGQQSESSTIEMKRKKGFSFRRRQEAV